MDGFIWQKNLERNFIQNVSDAMLEMISRYSLRPSECWVSLDEPVGVYVDAEAWATRNGLTIVPKRFVKRGYFFIGG